MGDEVKGLNLASLDIEQLEQRIELGHALPVHRHPDSCTDNGCEGFQGDCTHNKCIGYASCGTLSQPH